MTQVLLGMGSNIEPEQHLKDAAQALKTKFVTVQFSSVYQSAAVGMDGDDFLNACCLLEHDLGQAELLVWLKALEDKHGRDRSEGSWKPRTLDLDILMVDGEVVDKHFYTYGHIAVPALELMTDFKHKKTDYAVLTKVDSKL
ncbi:MAG: 2-amino-4-hydroxy-6-hydroxymethyldihydropteridine diphosphokinase [Zetaproteobacteria bacterium]|nr:MAG: 2-amino-4-hydroxy-6-hydroxymethyldihydropteridine diphosphokinase [Zetaproteobacteria bacterium]